jgi:hypothetical protein
MTEAVLGGAFRPLIRRARHRFAGERRVIAPHNPLVG